jgi:hypothetical protein
MPTKAGIMKLRSVRKSKRLLLLSGLMVTIFLLFSGCTCQRPPAYRIGNPVMIPDGFGGIIVAYQINKGDDLTTYLQRLDADGEALWDKPGIVLYKAGGNYGSHFDTRLISDNQGNYIVIFPQSDSLWAQKLDPEGLYVWQEDSIQITASPAHNVEAISDGTGGAIVSYGNDASGSIYDIYVQKVASDGSLLWDNDTPAAWGRWVRLASDDSGGVLMIWEGEDYDIFAQRLDLNGVPLWGEGLLLSIGINHRFGEYDIIGDGNGGAVAVWEQDNYLYTKVIDASGGMASDSGTTIGSLYSPRIISDGSQGYFVFGTRSRAIYAQRLDTAGNVISQETNILVGQSDKRIIYDIIADNSGNAVIVWGSGIAGNRNKLRAQRMNIDGTTLWDDNGIKVSNVLPYWGIDFRLARIIPDEDGGYFISWAAGSGTYSKTSSYIQHVDSNGNLLWGKNGVLLGPEIRTFLPFSCNHQRSNQA